MFIYVCMCVVVYFPFTFRNKQHKGYKKDF